MVVGPRVTLRCTLGFDVTSLQDVCIAGEKADLASENQLKLPKMVSNSRSEEIRRDQVF
jgi:hypothetical protein